jgi:type II secretory pathway component GspD/PulD (secretin)
MIKKAPVIFLALFIFGVSALYAEDSPAQASIARLPGGMEGRISLDLRNIDIVDSLKYLSMKTGLNIVTNKSVTGRVTLSVENAVAKDVFDIMLRSNSLAYDMKGDIYNVMTEVEYKGLYGKTFSDVRQVKVLRLKYSIPEQAFGFLDALKSDVGRVLVDPESGSILVMDSPAKIEVMEKALQGFEEKNIIQVFRLNYAKAKDVEEALKTQLDLKKVGLIKADEKGNQVIVQTLPERMIQVGGLIQELDQKTKEVLIEARIIQVKLSDETASSTQWEGLFNVAKNEGLTYLGSYPFSWTGAGSTDVWRSREQTFNNVGSVGSYPFSGTTTSSSAGKKSIAAQEMHLGLIGKHDFDIIMKLLQTLGETRILSDPKLAVTNNQEAKIHVGQRQAYVTTTTTTGSGGTGNTISEQVNFVDVGVMLYVVPSINYDGYVTMKVKAEVNSVLETLTTPTGNKIPIIDTSLAETSVMLKEGSTIIIGGLRKERNSEDDKQIPILGKIPLLGRFFSEKTKKKELTDLLIVLTPKMISGDMLVAGTDGKGAGKDALKSIKDYSEAKDTESVNLLPSEVHIPLDKEGLKIKGAKIIRR